MYRVDAHGQVAHSPIISSSRVLSVADGGIDPITRAKLWRITLTSEGGAINAAYTKAHLGEQTAIFCGSNEIMRPIIAGQSSPQFVVADPRNVR